MSKSIRKNTVLSLFLCLVSFGLAGCFKGEFSVDVKGNGSGTMAVAFGMTQQAKAMLESQGSGLIQAVEKNLNDTTSSNPKVTVKNWVDGDYEWMKAEKKFENIDDVNVTVKDNELFKSFSLKQNKGLFQNEFILDAVLSSLSEGSNTGSDININPSAFIQMRFIARLPGKIEETNGFADADDPNKMVWTMQGNQTTSIKARSVALNWLNISVLAIGVVLIGAVAFGIFGLPINKPSPKMEQDLDAILSDPSIQKTDYLVSLGIEDLLAQINTRALNSAGRFHKKTGEIALVWENLQGTSKFIEVKDAGNDRLNINGRVYPATRESAKKGILDALQQQNS